MYTNAVITSTGRLSEPEYLITKCQDTEKRSIIVKISNISIAQVPYYIYTCIYTHVHLFSVPAFIKYIEIK